MMIDIEDIKTLTLRPDQVLVIQFDTRPKDVVDRITQQFKDLFPNNKVVFLDSKIKIGVMDSLDFGEIKALQSQPSTESVTG
jgi:hypothetical protein